ncbi:MAG: hypothetical protein ABEI53_03150 [Candidatus Magasanikbacteria bacterium]
MKLQTSPDKIYSQLEEVPEDIRGWLGSKKVTNMIRKINDKLGLKEKKRSVISDLILLLQTKIIPPEDFSKHLSKELDVSPKAANQISEEIKDNILSPIQRSLKEWGVNINLIDVESSLEDFSEIEGIDIKQKEKKGKTEPEKKKNGTDEQQKEVKLETRTRENSQEENKKEGERDRKGSKKKKEGPVVIHEEEEETKKEGGVSKKTGFSLSPGQFFEKDTKKENEISEARVETPENKSSSEEDEKEEKVVHYKKGRSSMPTEEEGSFIDLSNLGPSKKQNKPNTTSRKNQGDSPQKPKKTQQKKQKDKSLKKDSKKSGNLEKNNIEKNKQTDDNEKSQNSNKEGGPEIKGNIVDLS